MATEIQAVGMIEFNSIAAGIQAADRMFKSAQVEPFMIKSICPGKFIVAVYDDVAAVQTSINAGLTSGSDTLLDHFVIPRINPVIIKAMSGTIAPNIEASAVGIIETFSAASTIVAADAASKAADVDVAEVRIAMGLGGKAFSIFCGDVAAVETAVAACSARS